MASYSEPTKLWVLVGEGGAWELKDWAKHRTQEGLAFDDNKKGITWTAICKMLAPNHDNS